MRYITRIAGITVKVFKNECLERLDPTWAWEWRLVVSGETVDDPTSHRSRRAAIRAAKFAIRDIKAHYEQR